MITNQQALDDAQQLRDSLPHPEDRSYSLMVRGSSIHLTYDTDNDPGVDAEPLRALADHGYVLDGMLCSPTKRVLRYVPVEGHAYHCSCGKSFGSGDSAADHVGGDQ